MAIPDVKDSVTVQMPAWNALYEIRDFASHVSEVRAANESGPLPIEKLDKQTWRITGSGTITISYDTFWDEVGPFASQLNSEHAFINPAMVLLYVPGRRNEDARLSLDGIPDSWRILSPASAQESATAFILPNYDEIADSPVEIGTFTAIHLDNVPAPIDVVN